MLVVNRFQAEPGEDDLGERLRAAGEVLAQRAGFEDLSVARNLDDPALWVVVSRWRDVGSYRRALSSYDVKLHVVPLLSRAVDEPSAYEVLDDGAAGDEQRRGGTADRWSGLNTSRPRDLGAEPTAPAKPR